MNKRLKKVMAEQEEFFDLEAIIKQLEIEEEEETARHALEAAALEPARPDAVPVIWHRDAVDPGAAPRDNVLPFRRPSARGGEGDMTSGG